MSSADIKLSDYTKYSTSQLHLESAMIPILRKNGGNYKLKPPAVISLGTWEVM